MGGRLWRKVGEEQIGSSVSIVGGVGGVGRVGGTPALTADFNLLYTAHLTLRRICLLEDTASGQSAFLNTLPTVGLEGRLPTE